MINLEYHQVFGSLIMAFISYKIYNINYSLQLNSIHDYLPFQATQKILKKIINDKYDRPIITKELFPDKYHFSEDEVAIALFPLIIYCHRNPYKLEQELAQITELQLLTPTKIKSIKLLAIIVFLILENKVNFISLSKQISQDLHLENTEEIKEIQLIENLIQQKSPLTKVREELITRITPSSLGIYQALYSFLSMPENIEVSLSRSSLFSQQIETTIVLTGFLLGLKHGYVGIPYEWRKAAATEEQSKEIETLSKQLVARWQGKLDNR